MTTNERFDETVSGWLQAEAPARLPERVLDATFERTRGSRQRIGWRALVDRSRMVLVAPVLGGAVVAVVAALALGLGTGRPAVAGPVATPDQRSPFIGTWISTSDADGGTQRMTVRAAQEGTVEIVVTDDVASVCSGTPSTMTGTGRVERSTDLVIPAPVYTCDDGSEPRALSGPPLQEQLRDLTYVYDSGTDVLTVGPASVWTRVRDDAPSPEPTAATTPTTSPSAISSPARASLPSESEVTSLVNGFLDARIAGKGAQQYLSSPEEDVPLLYATTSRAPYERAESEPVPGVEWPYGDQAFKVRLFAGNTVVEQLLFVGRDSPPRLEYERHGFATDIPPTTENGRPVAMRYDALGGEVSLRAAHPWVFSDGSYGRLIPQGPGVQPTTDGGQRIAWDEFLVLADPKLGGAGCDGPDPVDARALAERIRSDPALGATAPAPVRVGDADGLMMDVVVAAGTSLTLAVTDGGDLCPHDVLRPVIDDFAPMSVDGGVGTGIATGERMRLYILDVPGGLSMRTLAIAVVAPEATFERAVAAAAPVVDSIEFHAP